VRRGAGAHHRLLLLHGIGSNSRSFTRQLDGLGDVFDVVAWDAPGYGRSVDPPAQFTMDDFADAAAQLIASLGWQTAHVLGHSFGGLVAQVLYRRHPERVSSLILADTNTGSGLERMQQRLSDLQALTPRQLAERRAPRLVSPGAPEQLIQELVEVMAQIRPAGYAAAAVALGTADTRADLALIRVPTLVIHGERDSVVPSETGAELARAVPKARLVVIPGAGHASNQQAPEAYNRAVREFIDDLPTDPDQA
jgi:3-oxoadipate enol-lactonase